MKINAKITGLSSAKGYLNQQGKLYGNQFQDELIKCTRQLAKEMQADLNDSIDKGGVAFTKNAVLYFYNKSGTSVSCTIMIKDIQAGYLYDVIVHPDPLKKFVPTSAARLTKQGNIPQLKSNIEKGKYRVVVENGKKYLIDTTKKDTKTKTKRVIGVRETKKRKLIYDFYEEAEKGVTTIVSGMKGHFKLKKG
ncbi:hypothetical protein KXR10_002486 [Escherichia coli]|uniref:hypothetical protein n=1 Tax=Escherichia TaxID=561 RepID=UPI00200BA732|nr:MULTISPECIES: hypothetical protein [Escherichia]EEX2218985.1 hypothetical protein [Escherichia coli]EHT7058274.1 hypothetical protein [Escherichia coli]EKG8201353.1 hypothetical protein [Escherichia coli]MDD8349744.1 hypothetical protein [Escherichia coli]HAU8216420.1 hypothetical protein [Escherichia coli]